MFSAALQSLGGGQDEAASQSVSSPFVVEGGGMFNAVIRLCLTRMVPALMAALKVTEQEANKYEM